MILVTQPEARLYVVLQKASDGTSATDSQGHTWLQVCTNQLNVPGMRRNQISGYLAQLQRRGLYRKKDKYFGMVRLAVIQGV